MFLGTSDFGRWLQTCCRDFPDTDRYTWAAHLNSDPNRGIAHSHTETAYPNADPHPEPHSCTHCYTETAYTNANLYPGPHSYSCAHCHTDTTSTNTDPYPGSPHFHSCACCHPHAGPPARKCASGNDRYPCWRVHHGQRC